MMIHLFIFLIFLFSWRIFIHIMKTERRSLLVGFSFMIVVISSVLLLLFFLVPFEYLFFIRVIIISIVAVIGISFFVLNLSMIFTLILSGIKLIYKEGFSVSHALSLSLGVGYLAYMIIWPMVANIWANTIYNKIYYFFSFVILYFLFLMTVFCVSWIINLIPQKKKYNYIIVLGSKIIKDRVTPLLASRVLKGIEAHNSNPGSKIIFSGGKGSDEVISEGDAMCRYAVNDGLDRKNAFIEDQSTNTKENLMFSNEIIKKDFQEKDVNILVVTSSFHVFRALLIAKQLNIKCDGRGSKAKLYFSLNALIREFIGYISYTKKNHIIFLGFVFVLSFASILV